MSTQRFSKIGMLALCATVGLLFASPASAGPFTAVSNLGETTDNGIGHDSAGFVSASSFHTSASGYNLSAVNALLTNADVITHNFEARIYSDSSGKPGNLLQTLSGSPSLSAGSGDTVLTFNSSGYAFSANTTYWLALKTKEDAVSSNSPGVDLTLSNAQTSPVGWTIGDNSYSYSFDNGSSWTNVGSFVEQFSVNVTPEPATISLLVMGGVALLARRRRKKF